MATAGFEEFDNARDRSNGLEPPRRSRKATEAKKPGKPRTTHGSRKAKTPNGIHNRRNKRMGW